MVNITNYIIPLFVLFVIIYALYKNVDIFNSFTEGSMESFPMILTIFPNLLGMIFGINIFIKSGLLDSLFLLLTQYIKIMNIPIEIISMMIVRPISGSASLAILNSIFATIGPDSFIGKLASVIQSSTDTTFYVLTLYFGSVGIKKIKYSLFAGLLADLVGILASILIVNILF